MKKLAVLFPDIGYIAEQPLFYYSKSVLNGRGFEVLEFNYELNGSKEYKELFKKSPNATSSEFKDEVFSIVAEAYKKSSGQLKNISWQEYENIVFVSKGVGSVIASLFANKNQIMPAHILFAPLEPTFQFLTIEEGIVFSGMDDDFIKIERLKEHCKKTNLAVYRFDKCNHFLETGNIQMDLRNMSQIMQLMDTFLGHLDRTVYDFKVKNLDEQYEQLSKYEGKVLLIVNTATGCGFTPQYSKLEDIYEKYHKLGFTILDFPCNQFLNQAPGTSMEIHSFCSSRYNVQFPQYAKIDVNGEKEEKLYTYLKSKRGFQGFDMNSLDGQYLDKKVRAEFPDYETTSDIKWNFTKFLVDKTGHVVERYESTADLDLIEKDIERLLEA